MSGVTALPSAGGYSAAEVARLLDLSVGQVRSWVRLGLLEAQKDAAGELRFSFQDLVLLRAARELRASRIGSARIRRTLLKLRSQLPEGRTLRGLHIRADGDRIVVGDGQQRFEPESGQTVFDFDTAELARKVAPLLRKPPPGALSAQAWYERGCDLEEADPARAIEAYRQALALEPSFGDAQINLGRLLHERGEAAEAAEQYRRALEGDLPQAARSTASFNLGVALEDLDQPEAALAAYVQAIALDPTLADAHFNLARLHERRGQGAAALRHLRTYRQLTQRAP